MSTAAPSHATAAPTESTSATSAPPTPGRLQERGGALALTAGSVLVAVGLVLHLPGAPEDAGLTRAIAEQPSRWLAAHLLGALGLVLLAAGVARVARVARGRGAALAAAGALTASVGATLLALGDSAHGSVAYALAGRVDPAAALEIEKAFFGNPAVAALSGAGMLLPLGILLLGAGVLRARLVPRWAGVVLLLSPLAVQAALLARGPAHYLLVLPFVVGMVVLARTLVSRHGEAVG